MARRGRFQFSLRTLLAVVTIATVAFALGRNWYAAKLAQREREQEAVAAIEKLGGVADTEPWAPEWVVAAFGGDWYDFFQSTVLVRLSLPWVDDDCLQHLEVLSALKELDLNGTGITDAGLKHLRGLGRLQVLRVGETARYGRRAKGT